MQAKLLVKIGSVVLCLHVVYLRVEYAERFFSKINLGTSRLKCNLVANKIKSTL